MAIGEGVIPFHDEDDFFPIQVLDGGFRHNKDHILIDTVLDYPLDVHIRFEKPICIGNFSANLNGSKLLVDGVTDVGNLS